MQLDFLINLIYLTHFGQNWTYVVYRKPSRNLLSYYDTFIAQGNLRIYDNQILAIVLICAD